MQIARREAVTVATLFAVAALVRLPTLAQPLVEAHPFRQAQTAYTALLFHEGGIDLLRPPLPVVGPPWTAPFEFPLFQALASLVMDLGVGVEPALRGTSLAFFLLTGLLLWALLRQETDRVVALAGAAVFLFSPFGLLWSRTSMIEYLATAGGVGFVLAALRWDRTGSRAAFGLALAAGAVAMLVKVTTGIAWLLPALLVLRRRWPFAPALLAGLPALLGLGWTRWTDAVKEAGLITSRLTSEALLNWNIGRLEQRFEAEYWLAIVLALVPLGLIGAWVLPLLAIEDRRRVWGWLGLTIAVGVVAFLPLYAAHDYYVAAVSPAAAGLLAGGFVVLARRWGARGRAGLAVVVAAALVVSVLTFVRTADRWTLAYRPNADPEVILPLATQIEHATRPDELVAIVGRDWSPSLHFEARRRGIAVPIWMTPEQLDLAGYRFFRCPSFGVDGRCEEIVP